MKFNDLDLNKIRIFLYIYRALSIRGVARELHLTPAAISLSLKSLEESLGISLFTRVGRALVATEFADQLARLTTPFFSDVDRLTQGWRHEQGLMRGHLKLGLPGEFGTSVVMPFIAQFRKQYPEVAFTVVIREPQSLMPELISGRLNAVICDEGPYLERFPQTSHTEIAREKLVLVGASAFYDRDVRGNHKFMHLKMLDHIAYVESQEDLQKWYQHHFGKSCKVPLTVVADNAHAVFSAVKNGLGLGMLPLQMIEEEVLAKRLRIISTNKEPLMNRMMVLRLKERVASAVERAFFSKLKEWVQH